jgi:hypothetical protein
MKGADKIALVVCLLHFPHLNEKSLPPLLPSVVVTSAGLLSGRRRGVPVALQAAFVMAGGLAIAYLMYHVVKLR